MSPFFGFFWLFGVLGFFWGSLLSTEQRSTGMDTLTPFLEIPCPTGAIATDTGGDQVRGLVGAAA